MSNRFFHSFVIYSSKFSQGSGRGSYGRFGEGFSPRKLVEACGSITSKAEFSTDWTKLTWYWPSNVSGMRHPHHFSWSIYAIIATPLIQPPRHRKTPPQPKFGQSLIAAFSWGVSGAFFDALSYAVFADKNTTITTTAAPSLQPPISKEFMLKSP